LEHRTDEEGREIYQRCVGTASLLHKADTLASLRNIMASDMEGVLSDASDTLRKKRDQYNKIFEKIDDRLDEDDAKKILDRRVARVEVVDRVSNFRKDLVKDLKDLPAAVRRWKI